MSDSIWKKEISFRRAPNDGDPAESAEAQRVKELAFQRRLEDAAQAPEPAVVVEPAPPSAPESIWKKEIGFRRRPAEPAPVVEGVATPVEQRVALPEPPDSIWKKEISFRRKPGAEDATAAGVPAAKGEALAEPPVSIWKKEISFRRKADATGAQHRGDSIWHKEISLRRREARSAQIRLLAEEALRQVGGAEEPAPEPWLAEPALPPEPLPEPVAEVAPQPDPAPEPLPELPPEPVAEVAPQPDPAPAPPPEAPVEASPVPVEKTSFWKREIGGGKKAKQPKAEKPEKAEKTKAPKTEKAEKPKKAKAEKPKTRLRDVKITLPRRATASKVHGAGNHTVKRLVGLKVGASQLAAARVVNNGAAELVQVARQPLEQGVVVSGEVRDPEALAIALKQFFSRNKLPRKNVRLGIASNRIGVRIFDLVGIGDDKQLENAIRFRAQETLPIPLDEAVLDYHVLSEGVDEAGEQTQRVLLVVAYRELVDRYVSACKKAGITLAGVDLEAFALLRALGAPRSEETESDSALVAVAIGHDRSTFAVSDGRVCEFTRVIEWGGSTLSIAIARALDLAPSEVEQMKRLVSLESPTVPDGIDAQQYGLAVDAVRRQVQAFARELVSSLQFYQHQPGSLGIGEIAITGGTAALAGLAAELQSLIGVRVRVGDPLARLKVAKKLSVDEELGSYAVAIGLGIED